MVFTNRFTVECSITMNAMRKKNNTSATIIDCYISVISPCVLEM
jgi:hypothetical protein